MGEHPLGTWRAEGEEFVCEMPTPASWMEVVEEEKPKPAPKPRGKPKAKPAE